jgi:exodeoxyribonuclease V beta subunit
VCRKDLPASESMKSWRISSFTSLTAGRQVDDARDVADAAAGARVATAMMQPGEFIDFPAGRQPGIVLHELFERLDFRAGTDDVHTLAAEILHRARLADHDGRIAAVTTMVSRVLGDALPGAGFTLHGVPRDRTLREWAFHLPLGAVQASTFADAFAAHGGELARRYAPALRKLSTERTHGFLAGVVDLVFERGGRWYLVDWKSNQLGREPSHYESGELEREMFASHYVLQYHLYLTALHRFLRTRVAGYDYERDMGGAWYAFLRGIDGSGRGWFHDRPPRELIEALEGVMSFAADV